MFAITNSSFKTLCILYLLLSLWDRFLEVGLLDQRVNRGNIFRCCQIPLLHHFACPWLLDESTSHPCQQNIFSDFKILPSDRWEMVFLASFVNFSIGCWSFSSEFLDVPYILVILALCVHLLHNLYFPQLVFFFLWL